MKRQILFFLSLAGSLAGSAQYVFAPVAIASAGGFTNHADYSFSYTAGEMTMVQTFSTNGNIFTQGFQQPNDILFSGSSEISENEFSSFVIYPNPAIENLWFSFQYSEPGNIEATLFNAIGQKMEDVLQAPYHNDKLVGNFDVSHLTGGVYVLHIAFISEKDNRRHLFTKKFQVIN